MSKLNSSQKRLNPPYGAVSWYDKFFNILKRIKIEKVDKSFLETNEIASKEEYKVINGLRFLNLIDDDGKATGLVSLRVVGDAFTDNLKKIVKDAYSLLLSKIKLENALATDVTNIFIRDYKMGRSSAKKATKIFVFLAQQAKMEMSESLAATRTPAKERKHQREKRKQENKKDKDNEQKSPPLDTEEMIKIEYGKRFTLYLQKGNKDVREKTAKLARQFIDAYVEDAEEESV